MKKIKYLISLIIIFITIGITSIYAATGSIYLGLKGKSTARETGTYKFNNKAIFKIVKYNEAGTIENDDKSSIYCIKAGPGFGSESYNNSIINYTQYFDIKSPDNIESPYREQLPENMTTYNELVWLLDNIYMPAKTGANAEEIEIANQTKENLLNNAGVSEESFLRNGTANEQEVNDILESIQQIAIWYFTNPDGEYHNNSKDTVEISVDGISLIDKYGLDLVDNEIDQIYSYLVNGAIQAVQSGFTYETSKQSSIRLNAESVKANIEENKYIIGPYKIEQIGDEAYEFIAKITDGTSEIQEIKILNENTQEIQQGASVTDKIKTTIGKNFYLELPITTKVEKVKIQIDTTMLKTKQTMWTTGASSLSINQPVVIVEKNKENYIDEHEISIPKITGSYKFKLIKEDAENKEKLEGAKFNIKVNNGSVKEYTTNASGEIEINDINITDVSNPDTIEIEETKAPEGYNLNVGKITLTVTKAIENGKYVAKTVTGNENATVEADGSGINTVKINIENNKITGSYKFKLIKEDAENKEKLEGAKFNIKVNGGEIQEYTTNASGEIEVNNINITDIKVPDTIEIEETKSPEGYNLNVGKITLTVTKELENGKYVAKTVTGSENATVEEDGSGINTVKINIENSKITGSYKFKLVKEDAENKEKLEGAKFNIKVNNGEIKEYTTNASGEIEINDIKITDVSTSDTIEIEETKAPEGYNLNVGKITLTVTKELENGKYVAKTVTGSDNATVEEDGSGINTVKINIENSKIQGSYNLKIVKNDEDNPDKKLENAKFKITIKEEDSILPSEEYTTNKNGEIILSKPIKKDNMIININIEEIEAPEGYEIILDKPIEVELKTGIKDGKYIIEEINNISQNADITLNESTITINVANKKQTLDLALRKYITKINGKNVEESREPKITDEEKLKLQNGEATLDNGTTAKKEHSKEPLVVNTGDTVIYTIRIYNEGKIAGYAKEIVDYLPEGLELVDSTKSTINAKYGWIQEGNKVKTTYLANTIIPELKDGNLSYKDVEIECKVVKTPTQNNVSLKNIAEITKQEDILGESKDIDSNENNLTEDQKNNYQPETSEDGKGYEDDDDYEELVILGKYFDLSLRKFITAVNDKQLTEREPKVDVNPLLKGQTTAIYNHAKEPIEVKAGDTVTYTLRVYNEGQVDGYATKIVDHLPPELEFLPEDELNKKYGWTQKDERTIETTYLKDTNIEAFNSQGKELNYAEVQIRCKIKENTEFLKQITNIAEIESYKNDLNIPDRDNSKNVVLPSDEDLPKYKTDEINEGKEYIPGQEDDDDFEKVILEKFDLALRKFITGVNQNEITDRIPKVDTSKYGTVGEDGKQITSFTYNHTKEPVRVCQNDIVTYTIRVYNEGTQSGYAEEIKDDVPEGLIFLPDNEINKEYRWKMYDAEGKETTDASKAKYIRSDYLSKANEKEEGENLLKGYNAEEMEGPDYRDVKVAFKVGMPNTEDRIIINKAEISKDSDKDGNEVTDIDSTPDEWIEGEDDQDIEKIYVQYFDLALRKWVSQVIVIEDGVEKVKDTGHYAEQDPEPVVKVDLNQKRIDNTIIKFKYQIRITNEGEIAGYATEISDYIPKGLKFNQADNPKWKEVDGKIVTDQLKDTLLEPGEQAIVEVILTWINDEENMGVMVNTAEISEDKNESDTPDIDSTPNNKKEGEDDIDDAPVALTMVTGNGPMYIGITAGTLAIIAGGVFLIKKYVI